ncbi:MAG: EF-P lysine aminoacylase EpmA [Oligoflexia bacterium]|nr:EF-P lysine aminoacylase EpmA [Oligoflexia bacterium]
MTSDLKRTEFLKSLKNSAYPASEDGVLPLSHVNEITMSKAFKTAGRIQIINDQEIRLTSNGVERNFEIPQTLTFGGSILFEILKPNDIVLITIENKKIQNIKLLVPSLLENPLSENTLTPDRAHQWQVFIKTLKYFFAAREFIELRTPTLVSSPGLEPHLDVFKTQLNFGRVEKNYYLPTSPEFHLKKALALGFERCFEIKECFRNNEISEHHQPEFLMLEWYRAYATSNALIEDIKQLIPFLIEELGISSHFPKEIFVEVIKMEMLWKNTVGFDLTPQTSQNDLAKLAHKLQLDFNEKENFDDLFARIFLEKIEPELQKNLNPVIVWHYPPSQAALARSTTDGWADRFELYWKGLEIANAFHELNDPVEQLIRFKNDQEKKSSLNKEVVPIDDEFMNALKWGMPPSAGIALGVERLFMALFEIKKISEVRLFPQHQR